MQLPKINNPQLLTLLSTYWKWRLLWLATTVGFAAFGLLYVLFIKGDTWVAAQAIIVRDEANGAVMRLGRFQSQTEMKAAQETILEMARNAQVLGDALISVGRKPSWRTWLFGEQLPTTAEIEDLARNGITVRAPRGAELGTTEVIYIDVKQESPERAVALNRAVCNALENRMQQVRQVRADGVISELQTAKDTAAEQLRLATERLTTMETEAGADLGDLRSMTEANSGGGSNRTVLDTIKTELRQAELQLQQLQTDLQLATESYENPDQLLLTPSTLFNSQTGLKALRDGLANATINTSQMRGRYTATHPLVQTALQAEVHLREQLRNELGLSVQTLSKDRDIAAERVQKLIAQRTQLESRLEKIANIRAEYSNVASEVRARNAQLQESERELSQAQASRDAAMTSSLITRLDQPMLGEKPIGPGRGTILAGATLCGLLLGLGIVFLLSPLDGGVGYGRRRFDYSGVAGRRAADKEALGRASTPSPVAPADALPTASGARASVAQTNAVQGSDAQASSARASDARVSDARGGVPNRRSFVRRAEDQTPAPVSSTARLNFDFPDWARPIQLTEKLGQIVHAWRSSQQPIKPASQPETTPAVSSVATNLQIYPTPTASAAAAVGPLGSGLSSEATLGSLSAQANLPPTPAEVR